MDALLWVGGGSLVCIRCRRGRFRDGGGKDNKESLGLRFYYLKLEKIIVNSDISGKTIPETRFVWRLASVTVLSGFDDEILGNCSVGVLAKVVEESKSSLSVCRTS